MTNTRPPNTFTYTKKSQKVGGYYSITSMLQPTEHLFPRYKPLSTVGVLKGLAVPGMHPFDVSRSRKDLATKGYAKSYNKCCVSSVDQGHNGMVSGYG